MPTDVTRSIYSFVALIVLVILATGSTNDNSSSSSSSASGGAAPADTVAIRPEETSRPPMHLKGEALDRYKAREAYVQFLQTFFEKQGRLIGVSASGAEKTTLQLSSTIISEGSNTLAAAREVVESPEMVMLIWKSGFKDVIIRGLATGYAERYPVLELYKLNRKYGAYSK
jgi:hypothetical protein